MVFQSYALWPHMSVYRNISYGLELRKVPSDGIRRRVYESLELVGLEGLGGRYPSELSGGQQQRVALARSLVGEPQVLLLDEPLSNLDAQLRERMRLELRTLLKRIGITAVYVTHDQQEALALADRIVLMRDGFIEQVGDPRDLYDRPRTIFAANFLGLANVFPATVQENKERFIVRVDDSDGITLQLAVSTNGAVAGMKVNVVVRPEHIQIAEDDADGVNHVRGEVRRAVFQGGHSDYFIGSGSLEWRVRSYRVHGVGPRVTLVVPQDKIICVMDG